MSTDIHSIWIDSKSILLDMIKEYKLKIKGVFLHSLIIGTTHIIIAYVNVVNSTTFTANQALLLWIQCLIYKFLISLYLESHQTCFYLVIIFDNTLVDSNIKLLPHMKCELLSCSKETILYQWMIIQMGINILVSWKMRIEHNACSSNLI